MARKSIDAQKKRFQYDTLLDPINICNLTQELRLIEQGLKKKEKMVIYGKRNSGKTSLVKNVVIPHFRKKNPYSFVLFVDLMEVKDLLSLNQRIQISFQNSFRE